MNTPHVSELYRCTDCRNNYPLLAVKDNWSCPHCSQPINIRLELDNNYHSAYRLHPAALEVGAITTIDRNNINEILNVQPQGNGNYRIALKNYGSIQRSSTDWIFVIDGIWADYGF